MTEREAIIEIVNKLYIYTDFRQWDQLQDEVFAPEVFLDMTSMGGKAEDTTPAAICAMWEEGFKGLDAVNHLAGNYLVKLTTDGEAEAFAYATATHYKASATRGKTREFVGTYDFKLKRLDHGWRIYHFVYELKYASGNMDLA
ncbi:MAG: nuclear transport factor 2 family protein [Bacteroidota bacterium]